MKTDPQNVLLVEDNTSDATALQRKLATATELKSKVYHVESLAAALTLLRNKRFDLILLDLSLPDSQGVSTVRDVKRVEPNTPVVVLSGQEDIDVAVRALQAGADNYLVKSSETNNKLLERELLYTLERTRRAHLSKELLARSLECVEERVPDSEPPATNTCRLATEHVNRIESTVEEIRTFLRSNNPGMAENVDQILSAKGYHVALQELRSLLGMGGESRSTRVSDTALKAVGDLAEGYEVEDPEQELMRVIGASS